MLVVHISRRNINIIYMHLAHEEGMPDPRSNPGTSMGISMPSTAADYARGALCGLAAVSIWSGGIVAVGLGLRSNLTPWDVAAIRFTVAGVLLLPYVLGKGLALGRLGWSGLAAIVLGGGAPVLLSNVGLLFAPAAHAGALFPGVMPLIVAVLAATVLGEPFTTAKWLGFALILPGVCAIAWLSDGTIGWRQNIGHAFFLGAGIAFAAYTVAMRKARLDGLHAAALAAVGDLLLYMPIYCMVVGTTGFVKAAWSDIALQALVQGLLTAILSYLLYGRAVGILGASSGAAFAALSPAMTALMAIPVLGQWPGTVDWLAIIAISVGVYIVSGGRLSRRRA
jgi:drug/metabolite transporter (DMT)-like permease